MADSNYVNLIIRGNVSALFIPFSMQERKEENMHLRGGNHHVLCSMFEAIKCYNTFCDFLL